MARPRGCNGLRAWHALLQRRRPRRRERGRSMAVPRPGLRGCMVETPIGRPRRLWQGRPLPHRTTASEHGPLLQTHPLAKVQNGSSIPVQNLNLASPCRPGLVYDHNGSQARQEQYGLWIRSGMPSPDWSPVLAMTANTTSGRKCRRECAKQGTKRWGCYHLPFVQLPMLPGKPPSPLCWHAGGYRFWVDFFCSGFRLRKGRYRPS